MTNLEKVLSGALIVVSGLGIGAVVQAVKGIKKDQQVLNEIQEKCNKIKTVLNKPEIKVSKDEEIL